MAVQDLGGAEAAACRLAATFPVVVVTAGGDGVAVAEHGGESFSRPAEKVTLVSTHGAGDVFTGALVAELIRAEPNREAVATAGRAAARHVAGRG